MFRETLKKLGLINPSKNLKEKFFSADVEGVRTALAAKPEPTHVRRLLRQGKGSDFLIKAFQQESDFGCELPAARKTALTEQYTEILDMFEAYIKQ